MHFLLRLIRWLVHKMGLLLLALAIIMLPVIAINMQITDREVVKGWLADTDTYTTLRTESFNLIERESSSAAGQDDETLGEIIDQNQNLDQEKLLDAVEQAIPTEYLQAQVETIIDATYDWLSGETARPIFEVSLEETLPQVRKNLKKELTSQLAAIPKCEPNQVPQTFDLIKTECIPRNLDLTEQVNDFVDEFAGENGFLAEASLSGDDLLAGSGGTDSDSGGLSANDLKNAQTAYSAMKNLTWVMIVAALVGTAIVMATAKNWKRGLKEVGSTILSGTIFTFIVAVLLSRARSLSDAFLGSSGDASDSTVQAARRLAEPLTREIVGDVSTITAWLAGAVIVVGLALVFAGFWFSREEMKAEREANKAEREKKKAEKEAKKKEKAATKEKAKEESKS